jgi:hypothetical protein
MKPHKGTFYQHEASHLLGKDLGPGKGQITAVVEATKHIKIEGKYPDGRRTAMMISRCSSHELPKGTDVAIWKWFKSLGIILAVILIILLLAVIL